MEDILIKPRDLEFLLWDWLGAETLFSDPRFAEHDRETIDAILDLSLKLAASAFLPHFKKTDQVEPYLDEGGQVRVLPEIGTALGQFAELGLFSAGFDPAHGGMGLPTVMAAASMSQFMAASLATAAYPMLTVANARLITMFGSPEQIETFALPQIEGTDFGTMCLSEPQAGSGLGDIKTRAVPDGSGPLGARYRLTGNKMWISGGDQDVSRNIVHLVLAKIANEDGSLPAGTKGISLFIVPKTLPEDGGRNDIVVAGLNHKMGYRGTSNCLLNLGEGKHTPFGAPGAVGYLIGQEGQGLGIMFQMMNEARINVGLGGAAIAYRGYRHAVRYAEERVQGRSLRAERGSDGPVAIIQHPDVQRMLLAQKCYAEGALALVFYCSLLVDQEPVDDAAGALLALLTPIAKTWPSEWGLKANELAIQVHGGYGYTRDFDVEQLYRDARLNPIHEGTTGIQAQDLLGRKIIRGGDLALDELRKRIRATASRAGHFEDLAPHAEQLLAALVDMDAVIADLRQADYPAALANATAFQDAFGHIVLAWLWLDMACTSAENGAMEGAEEAFLAGKRRACRFFFECELPKTAAWLSFAVSLSDVADGVPANQF